MKRHVMVVVLALVLLWATWAIAANSVTQTLKCFGSGDLCRLTMSWTASSVDGNLTAVSVSSTHLATLEGKMLFLLRTDPGSTAPTDNYDITLTDARGDILGGMGANRDNSTTESVVPKIDGTNTLWGTEPWTTSLSFDVTGNSVNSATGVAEFWFVRIS